MTDENAIAMRWDGAVLTPANAYGLARANDRWQPGDMLRIIEKKDRWPETHRHYFGCVADAWANLPEHLQAAYPSPDHLRKKMLVRAGFANERVIACESEDMAKKVAAFIKPMDEYAVIVIVADVVKEFTAKSQSHDAMENSEFLRSKNAVLDMLDDMLGLERGTLAKRSGKAA